MLAGRDGTTYRLEATGDTTAVDAELRGQPWVTTIDRHVGDGRTVWHVGVSDEQTADRELLRTVVADSQVTVLAYGRHCYDLEDAFVHLVEQEPQP